MGGTPTHQKIAISCARWPAYLTLHEEYERHLRVYSPDGDSPLEREGSVWHFRAPVDALAYLAGFVGREHLERLKESARKVFSEHDPSLEVPPAQSIAATLAGARLTHSRWLRDGLATTLLLFAVFGDGTQLSIPDGAQTYVNALVKALPGLPYNDWRVIASLQDQLPLLIEATPRPLLDALELFRSRVDVVADQPSFPRHGPAVFEQPPHRRLVGLEALAHDPEYLPQVTSFLAILARVDPGGQLANRPIDSLANIFVPGLHNTAATVRQRLLALDQIIEREPTVGWNLLHRSLPHYHHVARFTAKPRFREIPSIDKAPVPKTPPWRRALVNRAFKLVGLSGDRWEAILPLIPNFSQTNRDRAVSLLEDAFTRINADDRSVTWAALRSLVNSH